MNENLTFDEALKILVSGGSIEFFDPMSGYTFSVDMSTMAPEGHAVYNRENPHFCFEGQGCFSLNYIIKQGATASIGNPRPAIGPQLDTKTKLEFMKMGIEDGERGRLSFLNPRCSGIPMSEAEKEAQIKTDNEKANELLEKWANQELTAPHLSEQIRKGFTRDQILKASKEFRDEMAKGKQVHFIPSDSIADSLKQIKQLLEHQMTLLDKLQELRVETKELTEKLNGI